MEEPAFSAFWRAGYARGLAIWESCLLVAAGTDGLVVLEQDTGKHLTTLSLCETPQEAGFAQSVNVCCDHAFVAKGVGGISVVDLHTGKGKHTFTRFQGGDAHRVLPARREVDRKSVV